MTIVLVIAMIGFVVSAALYRNSLHKQTATLVHAHTLKVGKKVYDSGDVAKLVARNTALESAAKKTANHVSVNEDAILLANLDRIGWLVLNIQGMESYRLANGMIAYNHPGYQAVLIRHKSAWMVFDPASGDYAPVTKLCDLEAAAKPPITVAAPDAPVVKRAVMRRPSEAHPIDEAPVVITEPPPGY